VEFQQVVQRRRMVRKFAPDPAPQPSFERILRNGVRGPSAGFCQGQAFLVLTGAELPKFWAVAGEATYGSVQTAAGHRADVVQADLPRAVCPAGLWLPGGGPWRRWSTTGNG